MNKLLIAAVVLLCMGTMCAAQPNVIPQPVSLKQLEGTFVLASGTSIVCRTVNREEKHIAEFLASRLRTVTGFPLPIIDVKRKPKTQYIQLHLLQDKKSGNEGYAVDVREHTVVLRANKPAGLFYAVQTLLQLFPPSVFGDSVKNGDAWKVPCVSITDKPRFLWRGMHLDVCRHYFPKEFIKRYIDYIAMYKMNTFHWHLTEDQGWRIEIKKYPRLTNIGSWRNGSMVGPYSDMKFDSIRYGGYYTQDDIREIVAYARERYVTIVPEIEMPGHSLAALASYPELSCTGGPFEVGKAWGVYDDVYCPKEETFSFLQNVLTEVCALFPGKYIHIGGDECPKERWKKCEHCQALIKRKKLKDENQFQSYFIKRVERFLNSKGKRLIGWDEILEGGLAPNAAVMSWRGTEGGIEAAKKRHSVVMTPGSHCYFDHYQGDPKYEPLAIGGYTTVEKVYSYEPLPEALTSSQQKYILGAQGNVWTEYITTPQHVEYMALPRMTALAEVLWSPKEARSYPDFVHRLINHFQVLDVMKVNYSKSLYGLQTTVKPLAGDSGVSFELSTPFNSRGIHYTVDGYEPTPSSSTYESPIIVTSNLTVKAAYFESEKKQSNTIEQQFYISKSTGKPITLKVLPNETYYSDGPGTLVNGIRGDVQRFGKDWLGFWGHDVDATIDLLRPEHFSKVTLDVVDEEGSWIYLPKSVEVFVSTDSITYTSIRKLTTDEILRMGNVISMNIGPQDARFVRLVVEHAGKIPEGKPGAGNDAWLFVDEIIVE